MKRIRINSNNTSNSKILGHFEPHLALTFYAQYPAIEGVEQLNANIQNIEKIC